MAKPNDVTQYRGVKDTADNISQEKPIEIGNKIWKYDPNANKGLASVLKGSKPNPTKNHVFGHLEASPHNSWVEYAGNASDGTGVDESSQQTTGVYLKTGQGARLDLGSRVYWPRTKEVTRLDAAMSSDTTGALSRNFGRGSAASLLKMGDKGLIITPAFEQGFTTQKGLSSSKVYKSFSTTIISYPIQTTHTETAELSRGGNPFKSALTDSIKLSKDQMEGELYFGASKTDSSSYAHPLTTTQGLDNWITTNVYSASKLSRLDLWDILSEWKQKDGEIHCSTQFKTMVTLWGLDKVVYDQSTDTDGLSIDKVKTPVGTFKLVDIDLFDQEPHLMGTAFFVPKGQIEYRPLIHEKNLDVRYNPISRDEIHSDEGEVYGEYGWHFYEEERFAKLSGINFAA